MTVQVKHRLLVCGGRKYGEVDFGVPPEELEAAIRNAEIEREYLRETLDALRAKLDIECVIQGGAKGADRLAKKWTENTDGIVSETYLANWKKHKKKAGIIRNQTMLETAKPTIVIAFPGGNGTKDMVERAKKAGIPVYEVRYETVEQTRT